MVVYRINQALSYRQEGHPMVKQAQEFHYQLRGGASGSISMSPRVASQLIGAITNATGKVPRFVSFNADRLRILLRLDNLISCRFLAPGRSSRKRPRRHSGSEIHIYHSHAAEPLVLGAEPMTTIPSGKEYRDDFFETVPKYDRVRFLEYDDREKEVTLVRAADTAMIVRPLSVSITQIPVFSRP
jgi:hypothetical protein